MPLLQVRITLEDVEPEIWRLIAIDDARTLSEVHDALQIAMGWTDSHLHLFEHPDGRRWSNPVLDDETEDEDERTVALGEVLDAHGLRYEYDFGDSWSHRLELVSSAEGLGPRSRCSAALVVRRRRTAVEPTATRTCSPSWLIRPPRTTTSW